MAHDSRQAAVRSKTWWVLLAAGAAWGALAASASGQTRLELDERGGWRPAEAKAEASPAEDPREVEDAALMSRVRGLLAEGKPAQARALLDPWFEAHARERGTGVRSSPYYPEALLLRGDAKVAVGDEYDALFDYEEIVRDHAGSEQFIPALERELRVANLYFGGLRRKSLGLRIDDGVPVAEEIVIRINERLPGSRLAERAMLDMADHYYREGELRSAAEAYDVFLQLFPRSAARALAMQRRTYATIAQYRGPRYDATGLREAIFQIEGFQAEFPAQAERAGMTEALSARIDESLAEQMLESAKWYLRREEPVSARVTLERLIRRHPRSAAAVEAVTLLEGIQQSGKGTRPAVAATPAAAEPAAAGNAPTEPAAPANGSTGEGGTP